ncbi:MAG: mechanosensitive ion channel family protein [Alphaproteobacteria bacterium]|nr:mechanosensitive ion channel family protein [Alphaproteobacteria bacterium]
MSWSELRAALDALPAPHAALVLVASLVLASLSRVFIRRVLGRFAARTRTRIDDDLIEIVGPPLSGSIVLAGCWYASTNLDLPEAPAYVTAGILATLAVMWWGFAAERASEIVLDALSEAHDMAALVQPRTLPVFKIASRALVLGGSLYFLLLAWDIDPTAWVASAGIVGIAVGFAAKDTLANLFAGVFIIADTPYKLGDYLVMGTGERGRVTEIGFRSTRILTRDDIEIIIPNAEMANARIVNESGGPHERERIRCKVGVAYGSDIDEVERILLEIARIPKDVVLDNPNLSPRVRLRELGSSSLDFELMLWIEKPEHRGRVRSEILGMVYKRFREAGIVIPFNQLDVTLVRGEG